MFSAVVKILKDCFGRTQSCLAKRIVDQEATSRNSFYKKRDKCRVRCVVATLGGAIAEIARCCWLRARWHAAGPRAGGPRAGFLSAARLWPANADCTAPLEFFRARRRPRGSTDRMQRVTPAVTLEHRALCCRQQQRRREAGVIGSDKFGWGTRIRTLVDGVRVRSPAARRSPKKRGPRALGPRAGAALLRKAALLLQAYDERPQHSGNFMRFCDRCSRLVLVDQGCLHADQELRPTLSARTFRHVEEPDAVLQRISLVPFGDVRRDGQRGSRNLVPIAILTAAGCQVIHIDRQPTSSLPNVQVAQRIQHSMPTASSTSTERPEALGPRPFFQAH